MCDGVYAEESRVNVIRRTMSKKAVREGVGARSSLGLNLILTFFPVDRDEGRFLSMENERHRMSQLFGGLRLLGDQLRDARVIADGLLDHNHMAASQEHIRNQLAFRIALAEQIKNVVQEAGVPWRPLQPPEIPRAERAPAMLYFQPMCRDTLQPTSQEKRHAGKPLN